MASLTLMSCDENGRELLQLLTYQNYSTYNSMLPKTIIINTGGIKMTRDFGIRFKLPEKTRVSLTFFTYAVFKHNFTDGGILEPKIRSVS